MALGCDGIPGAMADDGEHWSWVNLLRGCILSVALNRRMSAAIGGVDDIAVLMRDDIVSMPCEFNSVPMTANVDDIL